MTDFSIAISSTPVGGRAYANLDTTNNGELVDVVSLEAEWRDQNGLLLSSLTRTTVDVSGVDSYGNAARVIDITGTGTYRADLVIDATNYTPPANGLAWTLTATVTYASQTKVKVFPFTVVATTLDITFDSQNLSLAAMRQAGILVDVDYVAPSTAALIPLRSGPVYDIRAAYKNGVLINRPTDYTWVIYRTNVTAVAAPAVNDHYHFTIQNRSTELVTDVVTRMLSEFRRALQRHYDTAALVQSPDAVEMVKSLIIGQLKMDIAQGTTMDNAFWRSGYEQQRETRKQILRLQRGEEELYDSGGVQLVRGAGTIVGAATDPNAELDPTANDWVLRMRQNRSARLNGIWSFIEPDPILGA